MRGRGRIHGRAETLEELAICGTEAGRKESSSLAAARIITLT